IARGPDELGIHRHVLACDAVAFEEAAGRGEHEAALARYEGDLLPAFHVAEAPAFEDWLDAERRHLCERAADCAAALTQSAMKAGDLVAALAWARRGAELSPYDESMARQV